MSGEDRTEGQAFQDFGSMGQTEYAEHSAASRAKKTIQGPTVFVVDPNDDSKSIDPIQGSVTNASDEIELLPRRAYRLISSTDCYFRMSTVTGATAIVGDIYLPAKQSMIVRTDIFSFIAFIRDTADGIIQAVEVK